MVDIKRAINDYPYYAASLLKIKTKGDNKERPMIKPFEFFPHQTEFHNRIAWNTKKCGLPFAIVLKARQEGISTYCEGRIFHSSHMNETTKSAIITHDKESCDTLFTMCKLFYDELPASYKPLVKNSNKKELRFENPNKKTRQANPGLRSVIEVYTAGKNDPGRSTTLQNLHASEVASWSRAGEVIPAIMPTIPKNQFSFVVFESTAKGVGNYFHKEWTRAVNGESDMLPFFLAWFDFIKYTKDFNDDLHKQGFKDSLLADEKEIQKQFNLTLEQLHWRRIELRTLHGDLELFKQEYPCTAEEAFIVSGVPIFNRKKLTEMSRICVEPVFRGDININKKFVSNERGEFKLWEKPKPNAQYVMGVDVSDGADDKSGDYSCVEIFRYIGKPNLLAVQAAEWHGKIDPFSLGKQIAVPLAKLYNNALLSIEINAHGLATQQAVIETYWNLYRQENFDTYDKPFKNKIGWETNIRTKKLIVAFMSHCVTDMSVRIYSLALIKECMTFVRDNLNVAGSAAGSGFDDRIMSAMICLFTMHQSISGGEYDPYNETMEAEKSPIETDPSKYFFDHTNNDEMIDYEYESDDCWLNL